MATVAFATGEAESEAARAECEQLERRPMTLNWLLREKLEGIARIENALVPLYLDRGSNLCQI